MHILSYVCPCFDRSFNCAFHLPRKTVSCSKILITCMIMVLRARVLRLSLVVCLMFPVCPLILFSHQDLHHQDNHHLRNATVIITILAEKKKNNSVKWLPKMTIEWHSRMLWVSLVFSLYPSYLYCIRIPSSFLMYLCHWYLDSSRVLCENNSLHPHISSLISPSFPEYWVPAVLLFHKELSPSSKSSICSPRR